MHPPTKKRPILFSGPMVRAILENRKTQTRRITKWDKEKHPGYWPHTVDGSTKLIVDGIRANDMPLRCPYGKPGDRLWVRETWKAMDADLNVIDKPRDLDGTRWPHVSYRADHIAWDGDRPTNPVEWRPSIHMPQWASRITLEIEDIQVDRLNAISEEDAIAEGCQCSGVPTSPSNYEAYAKLWDSINGKGSWDANPWVWVVKFKRIEK